jgi:hypothetical protein
MIESVTPPLHTIYTSLIQENYPSHDLFQSTCPFLLYLRESYVFQFNQGSHALFIPHL